MEKVVQWVKTIVLKTGRHLPTILFSGTERKDVVFLGDLPNHYAEKIICMRDAGRHASARHNVGKLNKVFLIMEAWMVKLENGMPFIPAHQLPARVEVLVISCLDMQTQEQTVTTLEYVRDEQGNLIEIKESWLPHGVRAESPLLPAFVAGYSGS